SGPGGAGGAGRLPAVRGAGRDRDRGSRLMRVLLVSLVCPWPQDTGARMRAGQILRALGDVGDVDLYVLANEERRAEAATPPPGVRVRRVRAVARPRPARARQRAAWARPGGPPRPFAARDGAPHDDLAAWADRAHGPAWASRAGALASRPALRRRPPR